MSQPVRKPGGIHFAHTGNETPTRRILSFQPDTVNREVNDVTPDTALLQHTSSTQHPHAAPGVACHHVLNEKFFHCGIIGRNRPTVTSLVYSKTVSRAVEMCWFLWRCNGVLFRSWTLPSLSLPPCFVCDPPSKFLATPDQHRANCT